MKLIMDHLVIDHFLNYFQPKVLLGLTATPERMDGENIRRFCNSG
jgi:superfamily II DNA or RNA helicase